jgi:ABC-type hemin transport system ATPase subunit
MRRCGRSLVQRVSLTAARGELLALCGPEGSGTRTLLHLLSGHLLPDAGRILVDGRVRTSGPDPRRMAYGPDDARALLADPGDASVLLLERPVLGLSDTDAHSLLAGARRVAEGGTAVVLTADVPDCVAVHASTLALFVAGRLLSWGTPAVALVPALHLLGAGGFLPAASAATPQAGSIITWST